MSNQGNLLKSSALTKKIQDASNSAVPFVQLSGPLPPVNVTMGGGGQPMVNRVGAKQGQLRNDIIILAPKNAGRAPKQNPDGTYPLLEVNMNGARPQIVGTKTRPEGSSVKVFDAKGGRAAPAMMMLCRHLVATYQDLESLAPENAALAKATLALLDEALASTAVEEAPPAPQMINAGPRSNGPQIVGPRRVPSRGVMTTTAESGSLPDDLQALIDNDGAPAE
jgi:hypothetical protein